MVHGKGEFDLEGLPYLAEDTPAAAVPRLRAVAALSEASAALHADHAARLATLLEGGPASAGRWRSALRALLRRLRAHHPRARLRRVLREEGIAATCRKSLRLLRNLARHGWNHAALRLGHARLRLRPRPGFVSHAITPAPPPPVLLPPPGPTTAHPPARLFGTRVLIVAELSLPQCAKYRVWQKREQLASLGIACEVRDWTDHDAAREAMQLCARVIFYRVPGHRGVLALFDEARRLGLEAIWEVDDLIFDAGLYLADRDLSRLPPDIRRGALAGAALYARAWAAADRGIASTPALAALMQAHSPHPVDIVENALDLDTLAAAEHLLARRRTRPGRHGIQIFYGAGSRTHDGDVAIAADALATILARHNRASLRIVGEVALPACLDPFADRIERLPPVGYHAYLALLADADINLAPLEDTPFNQAKSNIKFVEAGILAIPSVCSAAANFASAITDGVDGCLPRDTPSWIDALDRLVADPALRARMGEAARASVLDRYAPARIAATRIAPLFAAPPATGRRTRLRVLAVHPALLSPDAGPLDAATRQALLELGTDGEIELAAFTAADLPDAAPYALRRLTDRAWPVIVLRPPPRSRPDPVLALDDPACAARFAELLDALRPGAVWLLGLHGLGAGLARACLARDIPYLVDLADGWWRPASPMPNPTLAARVIAGALHHATALVAPDEPTRAAAIAAGAPPDRTTIRTDDPAFLRGTLDRILPPRPDTPGPTLGIAAAVLLDAAGRLVLVRKRGTDLFMQPGGKIAPGETAPQALLRELGEELGLMLSPADLTPLGRFTAPAAHEPGWQIRAELFLARTDAEPAPHAEIDSVIAVTADQAATLPLAALTELHVLPLMRDLPPRTDR